MIDHVFNGKDGSKYTVSLLTQDVAKENVDVLKALLDNIEQTESSCEFIIASSYHNRQFLHKWKLSYICKDCNGSIVGVVISYYHFADDVNPFDSVYLHRIAVVPNHRNNYVAFNFLNLAIANYFTFQPWLRNVSVQVTSEPLNLAATNLYKKLDFYFFGFRIYKNKKDSIYILHNTKWRNQLIKLEGAVGYPEAFANPRLKTAAKADTPPVFYISSGSPEKRQQLSWLLSLYNFEAKYYFPPVDLIEPQVDKMGLESEMILVFHPLKQIARFIGNDNVPLLIEDTMLFIEMFNKNFDCEPELPGLDTKRWWRQLGNEGVLRLLLNSPKRRAKYVSQVGCYLGSGRYIYGRGELEGTISTSEKWENHSDLNYPITNSLFFHKIFVPKKLNKTLGQLNGQEFTYRDYRRKAIEDLLNKMAKESMEAPLQKSFIFWDSSDE